MGSAMRRPNFADGIWLVVYLAAMGLLVGTLISLREPTIARMSTPEAQADWDRWHDEWSEANRPRQESGEQVWEKSPEPNLLVLLRDYFGTCLFAAVFFSTVLFLVIMIFLRGAFRTKPQPPAG